MMKSKSNFLIGGISFFLLIWSLFSATRDNDFNIFMNAAVRLRHHADIYSPPHYHVFFQYFYSPLFALVLVPFTYFPFYIVETLWLMFMFFNIYDLWIGSQKYFNRIQLSRKEYINWVLVTLFFMLSFILYNVSQVQMTVFLVWGTFKSLSLFDKKKFMLGGLLLGLMINIKIMPLIFLPYLLYRNDWKAFWFTISWFALFLWLPALIIGWPYNQELLISWWHTVNPSQPQHLLETSKLLNSLTSTIPVFLTETHGEMNLRRNIIYLNYQTAILITNLIRASLILFSLLFFRTKPFTKITDKTRIFWECSYLFLITPLIFPQQNKYAYFYLFPAFMYMTYFFIVNAKNGYKPMLVYVLLISIIFTPLIGKDILGAYLFDWLQYYRVMVFCTLLFIPALLFCNPRKLIPPIIPGGIR